MTRLRVPDMRCGHCRAAVERALIGIDPAARPNVDLDTKIVEVESTAPDSALIPALQAEGYPAMSLA